MLSHSEVESRLCIVLNAVTAARSQLVSTPGCLSVDEEIAQIKEYTDVAGEWGLAWCCLTGFISSSSMTFSVKEVIAMIELADHLGLERP